MFMEATIHQHYVGFEVTAVRPLYQYTSSRQTFACQSSAAGTKPSSLNSLFKVLDQMSLAPLARDAVSWSPPKMQGENLRSLLRVLMVRSDVNDWEYPANHHI